MPEYLRPGVYVEELRASSDPRFFSRDLLGLRRSSTAIVTVKSRWAYEAPVAAFIGFTQKHPTTNEPQLVRSWRQYTELFGSLTNEAYLPYAVYGYFLNGGEQCLVVSLGVEHRRKADTSKQSARTLIEYTEQLQDRLEDIKLLCFPDLMLDRTQTTDSDNIQAVQLAMISYCEWSGTCFAILDSPPALDAQNVKRWRERANYDTRSAALYYPWIKIQDASGQLISIPPCGHLAGIYARNDMLRGVHAAPANEIVQGALDLDHYTRMGEIDVLNPIAVNVLRILPSRGVRVWGARSLSSDPRWRFIHTNRLIQSIISAIGQGMEWVLFQDARDRTLWAQIEYDLADLLGRLWRSGALYGQRPEDSFTVRCDEETNPQESQDRGQIIAEISLAVEPTAGERPSLRVVYFMK